MTLLRAISIFVLTTCIAFASTEPASTDPSGASAPKVAPWADVLDRYLLASQEQQARLRDSSMEVDVEGRLVRLKKDGSLHALRQIGRLGQITFEAARTVGDKTVIKDLISRYLTAEVDASKGLTDTQGNVQSIAISPDNYKFKYKATLTTDGRQTYIFQVTPKKNRLGLFKGEIWVDEETGMPIRESGSFVKSPSKFLRRLEFVRQYELRDGFAYPVKIDSSVETFLYGKAELNVRYSHYSVLQASELSRISPLGW